MRTALKHYLRYWAPAVLFWAAWILKDAKDRGIRRLYFLSRDTYPACLAAKELLRQMNGPEIRYIRVSRYSLRIPELFLKPEELPEWLFAPALQMNMDSLLDRVSLTGKEKRAALKLLGYKTSSQKLLGRNELAFWKNRAKKKWEELYPLLAKKAEAAYHSALGYLLQEGLGEELPIAIVDSGWLGTTQKSLEKLLGRRLQGYYFGLYDIPWEMNPGDYHPFYFGPRGDVFRKAAFCNSLFEAVLSEPVGTTLSYRKGAEGAYEPVLSEAVWNKERQEKEMLGLRDYVRRILRHQDSLWENTAEAFLAAGKSFCDRHLLRLCLFPSLSEAEWYGSYLFCDDMYEGAPRELSFGMSALQRKESFGLTEKLKDVMGGGKGEAFAAWPSGSIIRNGKRSGIEDGSRWKAAAVNRTQWLLFRAYLFRVLRYGR